MNNTTIVTGISILFIITVITGIVLSIPGRPLNAALFNVHKLIAIGVIILSVIAFLRLFKATTSIESPVKLLTIIAVISLIGLVVTGGLLSFDRFAGRLIVAVHAISTGTAGISLAVLLFRFLRAL